MGLNAIWDEAPVDITAEANFIWSIANKLRGSYMPDKYGDVIIPMVIIRRFECTLEKTKQAVVDMFEKMPTYPYKAMCKISGFQFYNTSQFDLRELCNDADNIAKNFNAKNFRKEKVKNKLALQEELGLEVNPKTMMIGIVSRLTDQKGFDLISYMMDEMCQDAVQFVILGTGEERYENMFRHFAWKYDKKVSANIYYSDAMSHKIYASCDAFLMPSLFEPCGLSQLMSLRYGTLPIVRETGGLKDTVEPYNEYEGTGTGFSFTNYNAHEMMGTVRYAERIYYDKKREWNKMIDRAMAQDFSWANSAKQYEEMYNWLIG